MGNTIGRMGIQEHDKERQLTNSIDQHFNVTLRSLLSHCGLANRETRHEDTTNRISSHVTNWKPEKASCWLPRFTNAHELWPFEHRKHQCAAVEQGDRLRLHWSNARLCIPSAQHESAHPPQHQFHEHASSQHTLSLSLGLLACAVAQDLRAVITRFLLHDVCRPFSAQENGLFEAELV